MNFHIFKSLVILTVVPATCFAAGSINPNVTQENIHSTICATKWSASIRPNTYFTSSLKKKQLNELGVTSDRYIEYVEDHIVPIEVGGSPRDINNLVPQLKTLSKKKDLIENEIHHKICDGWMTLEEGQKVFLDKEWK